MNKLLEEVRELMPGRARGHWNLQEQSAEDDLMDAHKKAGAAMKRVLGDMSRYGAMDSGWSTSVDIWVKGKMHHLEVGGNWLPKPGAYYVYFKFIGPAFDRSAELKSLLRQAKKSMSSNLARDLKRYGDVLGVKVAANGMVVAGVMAPEDKIQGLIKQLPRVAASWAEDIKKLASEANAVESILVRKSTLTENKTPVFNPYSHGQWVIRVEDYLYKVTGKKWTWKKPILQIGGGKKVQYKWATRKKRGALTPALFTMTVEYKAGPDAFEVETAYFDGNNVVASKTLRNVPVEQVVNPDVLFAWVRRKWNKKTGMKAESMEGARDVKKMVADWFQSMPPSDQRRIAKRLGLGAADTRRFDSGDWLDLIKYYRKTMEAVEAIDVGNWYGKPSRLEGKAPFTDIEKSLVDYLKKHKEITVKELAYAFQGGSSKIEKLLARMVKDGVLKKRKRQIGGAKTPKMSDYIYTLAESFEPLEGAPNPFTEGKAADGLLKALKKHGGTAAISDLAPMLRGTHYAAIERAAKKLVRQGKLTSKQDPREGLVLSLKEGKPTWTSAAKELLKKRTGKGREDLHYRAYLRSIINGNEAHAKHMRSKYPAAKQAAQDLIDRMGLAAYEGAPGLVLSLKEARPDAQKYAREVMDAVAKLRGAKSFRDLPPKGRYDVQKMLDQYNDLYVKGYSKGSDPKRVAKEIQDKYWDAAFKEGAPGPFAVSDNPPSLRDMIDAVKEQIRAPSWTYPKWALPKVELSE